MIKKIITFLFFVLISLSGYSKTTDVKNLIKEKEKQLQLQFKSDHQKILTAIEDEEDLTDLEVSSKIKNHYLRLTELYIDHYAQKKEKKFEKKAKFYLQICEDLEFEKEKTKKLKLRLKEVQSDIKDSVFSLKWLFGLRYLSFEDQVNLVSSSETYQLNAKVVAYSLNLSLLRESPLWGQRLDFDIYFGSSNIGESLDSIVYFQSGRNIKGIILNPSVYYRPKSKNTRFGLGTPILYKKSDYLSPSSSQEIESNSQLKLGVSLNSSWEYKKILYSFDIAKFFNQQSLFWTLGLSYKI